MSAIDADIQQDAKLFSVTLTFDGEERVYLLASQNDAYLFVSTVYSVLSSQPFNWLTIARIHDMVIYRPEEECL